MRLSFPFRTSCSRFPFFVVSLCAFLSVFPSVLFFSVLDLCFVVSSSRCGSSFDVARCLTCLIWLLLLGSAGSALFFVSFDRRLILSLVDLLSPVVSFILLSSLFCRFDCAFVCGRMAHLSYCPHCLVDFVMDARNGLCHSRFNTQLS